MVDYISKGADKAKLIMGIPLYGQSFTTRDGGSSIGSTSSEAGSPGRWTKQPGMLGYYEICQKIKSGWMTGGDARSGSFAYEAGSKQWVGYDSPADVQAKANYVLSNGLGGVSLSTLDLDDFNNLCCGGSHPLVKAVSQVLLGTSPEPAGCGRPLAPVTPAPRPPSNTDPWDDGSNRKTTTYKPTTQQTTSSTTTTPSSTTTVIQDEPAECSEGEHFRHETSCQKYYRCVNGKKQLHSCAGGLGWDNLSLRCDWLDNVKCHKRNGKLKYYFMITYNKPIKIF